MTTAEVASILVLRWVPFERRLVDDEEVFYGRKQLFCARARQAGSADDTAQRLYLQGQMFTLFSSVRG